MRHTQPPFLRHKVDGKSFESCKYVGSKPVVAGDRLAFLIAFLSCSFDQKHTQYSTYIYSTALHFTTPDPYPILSNHIPILRILHFSLKTFASTDGEASQLSALEGGLLRLEVPKHGLGLHRRVCFWDGVKQATSLASRLTHYLIYHEYIGILYIYIYIYI